MKKKIAILIGRGENCQCVDCPVLYGGDCPYDEKEYCKCKEFEGVRITGNERVALCVECCLEVKNYKK